MSTCHQICLVSGDKLDDAAALRQTAENVVRGDCSMLVFDAGSEDVLSKEQERFLSKVLDAVGELKQTRLVSPAHGRKWIAREIAALDDEPSLPKQKKAKPAHAPSETKHNSDTFLIRPFRLGDEPDAYAVCLQTGDAGKDASHLYQDPQALGNRWVGPYLKLQSELAFVLLDSQGVCGYSLGCLDTVDFFKRYCSEWLPTLQSKLADPCLSRRSKSMQSSESCVSVPSALNADEIIYEDFHHPHLHFPKTFEPFPSHLHIDIVERAQGRGLGTQLISTVLAELKRRGSKGVHLEMHSENSRAFQFYTKKFGFRVISRLSFDSASAFPVDGTGTSSLPAHKLFLGLSLE